MTKKEIIFGRKPILDALNTGNSINKVILLRGITNGFEIKTIKSLCDNNNISLQVVPIEKFEYLVKKFYHQEKINHQGVLALISPIQFFKVDDILNLAYSEGRIPFFLILEGITDTKNFGAIIRSAESFAVSAIIIDIKNIAAIDGNTVKSSAGAILNVPICKEPLDEAIEYLKDSGIQLIGTHLEAAKEIHQIDLKLPSALVLGSEGNGITDKIEASCDKLCKIYTPGKTESLNVGVSCGIALYETYRQRINL